MDEGTQITAIWQDYDHHREVAVGLYRVWDRKRSIHVWAEDGHEACKMSKYAGLKNMSSEPVLAEHNGSSTGDGERA